MIALLLAMRDEAQPLISHFALQPLKTPALFPVFHNAHIWLSVSGVGKANAAAAVTALYHVSGQTRDAVWLNVGIAGHADLPIGTLRSAHSVRDRASGGCWYPPQVLLKTVASSALTTVDAPEVDYPDDCLYDMESSGFYAAAARCSTSEVVQCLKIVSDNSVQGVDALSPCMIGELVAAHCHTIADVGAVLHEATQDLRSARETDPSLTALMNRHRFSMTQKRQLVRLARRLSVLAPQQQLIDDGVARARSSREVLERLRQRLDALPVTLGVE